MKRIHFLMLAPLVLEVALLGNSVLRAQDGQLTLDPPLSEIFPFENLPDGVHLEFPVLLNDHTVLRPDAVLHFIYLDPDAVIHGSGGPDDGTGFHSHVGPGGALVKNGEEDIHGHADGAAGGWGNSGGNEVAGIYDDQKNDAKLRKAELDTEVWKQKDLFDDALERATELGTVMVYSLPSQKRTLTASLDLPEGMLLGEVGGHVRVLGLKEEARAFAGGVRAGDEIRSFNAGAPVKSLGDFMREYAATKHQAKATGNEAYAMQIWRPANAQAFWVKIAAPPAIPSFLNDINASPVDKGP